MINIFYIFAMEISIGGINLELINQIKIFGQAIILFQTSNIPLL
jgi:hypothetical protein